MASPISRSKLRATACNSAASTASRSPPAPSPISRAIIWTITRASRTISRRSSACSPSFCRKAPPPWSMSTAKPGRRVAAVAEARGLKLISVGRDGQDLAARLGRARRLRSDVSSSSMTASGTRALAAGRRLPGLQRAGRGRPGHGDRRERRDRAAAAGRRCKARAGGSILPARRAAARRSSSTMPTRPMRSPRRSMRLRPYVENRLRRRVRLRRRPRQGQAARDGKGRRRQGRSRHRHRRQSAQRESRRDPQRDLARGARRASRSATARAPSPRPSAGSSAAMSCSSPARATRPARPSARP